MNIARFILPSIAALISCTSINAQSIYPGQHKNKFRIENSAPVKAESFELKDVRLLPGRVHDNLSRDSAWMASIQVNRLLHSFRNNAGVYAGLEGGYESVKKLGGWESLDCDLRGHTTGHLMSAYGLMYAATGDNIFKLKGDSIVNGLEEVQAALGTGYLSAFPEELINRNLRGKSVWAPWYTLHKILSGLIDQYLYAGNDKALDIAVKMGNWAYSKLSGLPEETRRLMLRNEFGGINEAFFNLYSITGNPDFQFLANFFYHNDTLDMLAQGNTDFGKMHTNTFIPKVIGEIRNYELSGNERSKKIASIFWNEMVHNHAFATGSLSQKEHFFDTSKFSHFINGYTGETCCTYNLLKLSRHMFCLNPDPEIADYYECALFNHILAQQDPQSGMVCYFLPLLSGAHKVYSTPEQSFWCCVGSGFESHAKYAEAIYYHTDNDLYVNLLIPSRLEWLEKGFTVSKHTDFPVSDLMTLSVEKAPKEKIKINLRHPSWCRQPEIKVNGKTLRVKSDSSTYIAIERKWKKGDRIEVRYPMALHFQSTPDDPSKAALLYGPIVLAGDLGAEGVRSFSDPTVRNDYYTFDYRIPTGLNTTLNISGTDLSEYFTRVPGTLEFNSKDGHTLRPLFDTHHTRYVVYWDLRKE